MGVQEFVRPSERERTCTRRAKQVATGESSSRMKRWKDRRTREERIEAAVMHDVVVVRDNFSLVLAWSHINYTIAIASFCWYIAFFHEKLFLTVSREIEPSGRSSGDCDVSHERPFSISRNFATHECRKCF